MNWEAYINSVNDVEENAFFIQYQLLVDGNLVGMTQRSNYTFVIAYNDGGNIVQEQSPFLFTTDGFRFREPVSLAGVTVQNFVWDPSSELFTCTDEGATNVKMKGIYPEGYIKYNDYLGNYTLTCKMYKDNNLTDEELPISIIEDVENKSYILKGLIGDIVLDYDRGEGIMSFKTQKVGYISGYYLGCTTYCYAMGFYPTYISYQAGLMFGFVANVQQSPFGFTFEDDGVFEAVGGAKADYMAFDRYSAPDYSQSSYVQGVARMYGEMVFMKVEE